MPKISIIVPIFKSEKYLRGCIKSILEQDYKDIELILVDDGSPDSCGNICEEYAKKDSRIIVIHKNNGGQSSARNAGIDIARGQYITFVDSDDTIAKNTYSLNINLFESMPQVDIIQFPCIKGYGGNSPKYVYNCCHEIKGSELLYKAWLRDRKISNYVCNKIFRKSLFVNKRFKEGICYEDRHFISEVLADIQGIYLSNMGLYFYFEREGQTTSIPDNAFILSSKITADLNIYRHIKKYPSLSFQSMERYYNSLYYYNRIKKNHWAIDDSIVHELRKNIPSWPTIFFSPSPIGIKLLILKAKLLGI